MNPDRHQTGSTFYHIGETVMSNKLCPSCEASPVNSSGVCKNCEAIYVASLGVAWRDTEVGQFLVQSNSTTATLENAIAFAPTGSYILEAVASPSPEPEEVAQVARHDDLNEMIDVLVRKHGWGSKRIHAFLRVGGYALPSLRTLERRVRLMKEAA